MAIIDAVVNYRRWLKRRNCSPHTVRTYMNTLKHFVVWLAQPIETVDCRAVVEFIDRLIAKRLHPQTINCYLDSVRSFYNYLINEEQMKIANPVKCGYLLRLPRPLPRHLRDEEVPRLFAVIHNKRDRAMFMLMLRCGMRVEEVAKLTLPALDLPRSQLFVYQGKGNKGRVVYVSNDAKQALTDYLQCRAASRTSALFLVDKGRCKGGPISVRGIQKRMELYAQRSGLEVSCHQLRHTMATQLLNADAALVRIQDLLGHARVRTTQRYCRVSNLKVQRDYQQAIGKVIQRHAL
jgi:site-specific recombinase XerD